VTRPIEVCGVVDALVALDNNTRVPLTWTGYQEEIV
jgi:hypothetical protein